MIKRRYLLLLTVSLFLFVCIVFLARRHTNVSITPKKVSVFTSTRYITSLALTPEGDLWAGTLGGLLQRKPDGTWRKFTRQDGLPSHEVRGLEVTDGSLIASFPTGQALWRQERWKALPAGGSSSGSDTLPDANCTAQWHGTMYAANATGLFARKGTCWQPLRLPPSSGTHVSALLPMGDHLWAALFGEGLWAFDGSRWQPVAPTLPDAARFITALAGNAQILWVGTRRAGVWERHNLTWTQHLQQEEPVDHNCQALAIFGGNLYVSTLEEGLAIRTSQGWGHAQTMALSSNAPRQMAVFQGRLYLRHGNGKVDCLDGHVGDKLNGQLNGSLKASSEANLNRKAWERNVCGTLPHRQVSALAADGQALYAAQWGGWSAFDGTRWTHHLDVPELQGLPITALCPQGNTLWIGTQGHGLAEVRRADGAFLRWHDERVGLPDDWITTLTWVNGTLYAGTFVGGLAHWGGQGGSPQWKTEAALKTENVTALEPDGAGGLFVATRASLWHQKRKGTLQKVEAGLTSASSAPSYFDKKVFDKEIVDKEIQTLCYVDGGLWIGTRTGLFFCPDKQKQAN